MISFPAADQKRTESTDSVERERKKERERERERERGRERERETESTYWLAD